MTPYHKKGRRARIVPRPDTGRDTPTSSIADFFDVEVWDDDDDDDIKTTNIAVEPVTPRRVTEKAKEVETEILAIIDRHPKGRRLATKPATDLVEAEWLAVLVKNDWTEKEYPTPGRNVVARALGHQKKKK
jgi:hypothetical protein